MFFSCNNFCRTPRKLFDREVDVTNENILCTESDIVHVEDYIHSTPYPQHTISTAQINILVKSCDIFTGALSGKIKLKKSLLGKNKIEENFYL